MSYENLAILWPISETVEGRGMVIVVEQIGNIM